MRKQIKGILAAALSVAMVVSLGSAAGVNKASAEDTTTDTTTEAKHTYNAILGFESAGTPDWAYRKFVESEDQGIKSKDYDCLTQYMATNTGKHDASMTNAKIDKDGTYTVTIDNIDFSKQTSINMAYVITDIPTAMKGVEFTNVKYSVDGEVVATQDKAVQKYDKKDYYMLMSVCTYNNPSNKVNEKGVDFDKSYKAETVGLAKGKTIKKSGVTYKVTTAATYTEGTDKKTTGKVQVTGFDKKATTLKVADTIKVGTESYAVTSIKAGAFKGASKVTAVTLGKKVKSIGKDTFVNCKKLKTLTIGVKLSSVTKNSFKGCKTVKVKGTAAAANKKLLAKQNKTVKFK